VTIPDLGSDLVSVVLRTAIVYVCLVVGFRLAGKREAGQLSTLDLVVLLIIANAVQNAMVGQNTSLIGGLVAAGVILGLDRLIHAVADRWLPLSKVLDGEPTTLVEDGQILRDNLRSEGISDRELSVALRQNGLLTADEARFVFLETNGQISVIPRFGAADGQQGGSGDASDSQPGQGQHPVVRTHRRRRRPGRLSGTSM
jgi:uncharacterized membrane protein YcaP (DUF421 family)